MLKNLLIVIEILLFVFIIADAIIFMHIAVKTPVKELMPYVWSGLGAFALFLLPFFIGLIKCMWDE